MPARGAARRAEVATARYNDAFSVEGQSPRSTCVCTVSATRTHPGNLLDDGQGAVAFALNTCPCPHQTRPIDVLADGGVAMIRPLVASMTTSFYSGTHKHRFETRSIARAEGSGRVPGFQRSLTTSFGNRV